MVHNYLLVILNSILSNVEGSIQGLGGVQSIPSLAISTDK